MLFLLLRSVAMRWFLHCSLSLLFSLMFILLVEWRTTDLPASYELTYHQSMSFTISNAKNYFRQQQKTDFLEGLEWVESVVSSSAINNGEDKLTSDNEIQFSPQLKSSSLIEWNQIEAEYKWRFMTRSSCVKNLWIMKFNSNQSIDKNRKIYWTRTILKHCGMWNKSQDIAFYNGE